MIAIHRMTHLALPLLGSALPHFPALVGKAKSKRTVPTLRTPGPRT